MPTGDASAFSDDELLALLKDPSVAPEAIASEMQDAGAEPLAPDALARAREALADLSEPKAALVASLPERLREVLGEEVLSQKSAGLAAALAASSDKTVAKEGKRLVHILKTRGVKFEAPKAAPSASAPGEPGRGAEELPTFMSNVVAAGERILLFAKAARSSIDVAQLIVSDEVGVTEARLTELPRREYRKFVANLSGTNAVVVGEVPRAYARGLVTAALDLTARARKAIPRGFNDVAFVLGPSMPPSPSPGRALEIGDDAAGLSRRAAELLTLAELRAWMPEESTLQPLALRIEELGVSPLYIDDAQREQALRDTMDRAIRDYWTDERRRLFAERLFDTGYLLHEAGRAEHAAIALASARELDSDRNLEGVTFCYALFEKLLPVLRGKTEPPPEHTSPGGIVLP